MHFTRAQYEAERALPNRNYAHDHDYFEWVHFQRAHVYQLEQCPTDRKDDTLCQQFG